MQIIKGITVTCVCVCVGRRPLLITVDYTENELYCVVSLLGSNQMLGVFLPQALLQLNDKLSGTINNTTV